MWVVKETACAAHIYGKRRVHMEAFTSMHHWQDGPFDLKPSADRAFCEGANHMVWHTASHQPPEAGRPGWVYGAGTHLTTNLVWWPMAKAYLDYLARCSFLLQQGQFVGDVCYYYGDQGYNFVPPKHVEPSLGYGYDYDVTNRDVLLERMSVRDGKIELPEGIRYALLVLPDRQDIDLEVLQQIERFVRAGATVVGPRPNRATGLTNYRDRDQQVRKLAERLWGPCDGHTVFEHAYGEGRMVWGRKLRELLAERGIGPDFAFTSANDDADIDFIHRRTDQADIYFVRNRRPNWEQIEAVFRVPDCQPQRWDPDSARMVPEPRYRTTANGVAVPLRLAPHGSTFVVFQSGQSEPGPLHLAIGDRPAKEDAVRIDHWDGSRLRLTAFQPGMIRASAGDTRAQEIPVGELPEPRVLGGPWELRFPPDLGAPAEVTLERLISWTEHPDAGVRYFSGIGSYHRSFTIPAEWRGAKRRVFLDLGDLWSIAQVYVNGTSQRILWKPPYRVDISESLRDGANELVIEVANTWSNRLVGDARSPESSSFTKTNITSTGGRRWKDAPLLPSGLFGPVRLIPAQVVEATLQ
jgi:hypothetical protein